MKKTAMLRSFFAVPLFALTFFALEPREALAMPTAQLSDVVSSPVEKTWGGCGPYGHRGPWGGCRRGGQWGGGGWGWGGGGWRGPGWGGGWHGGPGPGWGGGGWHGGGGGGWGGGGGGGWGGGRH